MPPKIHMYSNHYDALCGDDDAEVFTANPDETDCNGCRVILNRDRAYAEPENALTLAQLKAEMRLANSSDPWGDCMSWWFAVAGELTERGDHVPPEWHYRQSPLGAVDPDQYEAPVVALAGKDLQRFGAILHRYAGMLCTAGKDY